MSTWIGFADQRVTFTLTGIDPETFELITGISNHDFRNEKHMTDAPTLTEADYDVLTKFQTVAHANARAKGFHDVADRMKVWAEKIHDTDPEVADLIISNHYGNRLLLVVSELIEAQEELRHGHAVDEEYIANGKPEGVHSELNDAQIRLGDLLGEIGVESGKGLALKMGFNTTRERLHGGKKF